MSKKNNKKPDYSNAKVSKETCDSIREAFSRVRSDTITVNDQPILLYPNDGAISTDGTKILMIQQAVTESLKKGATLLSRTKIPNV